MLCLQRCESPCNIDACITKPLIPAHTVDWHAVVAGCFQQSRHGTGPACPQPSGRHMLGRVLREANTRVARTHADWPLKRSCCMMRAQKRLVLRTVPHSSSHTQLCFSKGACCPHPCTAEHRPDDKCCAPLPSCHGLGGYPMGPAAAAVLDKACVQGHASCCTASSSSAEAYPTRLSAPALEHDRAAV